MPNITQTIPPIVSNDAWLRALNNIRQQEKNLTRQLDALAAARRRLPVTAVNPNYYFSTVNGSETLVDLFRGRQQLIIYHHMLKPKDPAPCSGCCMVVDNICTLAPLHARNTEFLVSACAPYAELSALAVRLGWRVPCVSSTDNFHSDMGISDGFGVSVFIQYDNDIFRSYFTSGRGVEGLGSVWSLLDLTPLGRQELWEDSPSGWPQSPPYQWWRLNDSYE